MRIRAFLRVTSIVGPKQEIIGGLYPGQHLLL